jgi:hypothetical protein
LFSAVAQAIVCFFIMTQVLLDFRPNNINDLGYFHPDETGLKWALNLDSR